MSDDPLYVRYHDEEWGVALHDDQKLFELLTLEGAQAGLSWLTVLKRRDGYRRVFEQFDPHAVAKFNQGAIERILLDDGVIRHRQKIESVVKNARAILAVQQSRASFADYLWELGTPRRGTDVSTLMSKQLRRDGFSFVGATICHSLRQASGMVNEHARTCFRRVQIQRSTRP